MTRDENLAFDRKRWMSVLARASAEELRARLESCAELPAHVRLRGPESGLVMVRGRAGGMGAAFNLGEMSVTRCTVKAGAQVGHAYIAGRDFLRAELAARVDAGLQDPERHADLIETVVVPLARAQAERREKVAEQAAATKVEFFTMATMRT